MSFGTGLGSDVISSLTIRAEQAMLGAVLADPMAQQYVLDLVEPADFQRPWHAQVLAAMRRVQKGGRLPGPEEVYAELRCDPDLPRSVSAAAAVPLADLMEASPRTAHALAYAAMVMESGIRRRLELAGSRLAQATETGDLSAALRQCAQARRELRACHTRWLSILEPFRGELSAPPGLGDAEIERRAGSARVEISRLREDLRAGRSTDTTDRTAGLAHTVAETASRAPTQADEAGSRVTEQARPLGHEAEVVGEQALRDLTAAPLHIAHVRPWLRPEHFARPEDGELFAVMRDLDAAGGPVDSLTITWEAARRGIQADPAKLADGNGPLAVATAHEVHRHGLLAQAAATGRDIQVDAADPARNLPGQFQSADDRLRALLAARPAERQPKRDARVITMPRQIGPREQPRRPGREAVP
jgi:replicative DNA helicase